MVAALFALQEVLSSKPSMSYRGKCITYVLLGLWWGYQVITADNLSIGSRFPPPVALTRYQLDAQLQRDAVMGQPLPDRYEVGMDLENYGIPFNGAGWDTTSGETKASAAFFVDDPEFLQLEVTPAERVQLAPIDYEIIQAKIGLEFLTLESSIEIPGGRLLVFRGPQNKIYQSGIQVAFLGFVTADELSEGDSRFRLLRVRWCDD
jgi:hypothetical protein